MMRIIIIIIIIIVNKLLFLSLDIGVHKSNIGLHVTKIGQQKVKDRLIR